MEDASEGTAPLFQPRRGTASDFQPRRGTRFGAVVAGPRELFDSGVGWGLLLALPVGAAPCGTCRRGRGSGLLSHTWTIGSLVKSAPSSGAFTRRSARRRPSQTSSSSSLW